jgi:hypothetical protein
MTPRDPENPLMTCDDARLKEEVVREADRDEGVGLTGPSSKKITARWSRPGLLTKAPWRRASPER